MLYILCLLVSYMLDKQTPSGIISFLVNRFETPGPSPVLVAGGKLNVKTLGGIHSKEYDFWAKKLRITKRCNGALKSEAQNCQKTSNSTFVVVSKHNLAFCGQQQEFMRVVATNLHLAGDHPNPKHFF